MRPRFAICKHHWKPAKATAALQVTEPVSMLDDPPGAWHRAPRQALRMPASCGVLRRAPGEAALPRPDLTPGEGPLMVDRLPGGVGVVLSGAVAQGGFEAGVLATLARSGARVVRLAGTSSGALNATLAAAGVATGRLEKAAAVLEKLWLDDGSWQHIADLPVSDWLHLRGAFDTKRLQGLVRNALAEVVGDWKGKPASVGLTLVTTNLDALPREGGKIPLPTYEQAIRFGAEALVDPAQWDRLATAAAASATFPGLFSPTSFDGAPCVDGGAVNNTPISYVLEDPPEVDTVVVVTTEPPEAPKGADLGGLALVARAASAVINERIAYDLTQALKVNERYQAVARALDAGGVSAEAKVRVLDATGYRLIKLYLVQPDEPLPGDAFSGFLHRDQRSAYIAAGERAQWVEIGGARDTPAATP
jgi:predicted acylesterase/phospholipase RssA